MKKTYKKPTMALINIENENILAGSGGVGNGGSVGRSYIGTDVSYGKGMDDDWDEEDF